MYSEEFFAYYNLDGCFSDTSVITVGVEYNFIDFDFPNVITANEDGINDELDIQNYILPCQGFDFRLFNRCNIWCILNQKTLCSMRLSRKSSNFNFSGKTAEGQILNEGVTIIFWK